MNFQKSVEKWKRSFRKRFSKRNPVFYYKKKLIDKKNPLIFDVGAHIGRTAIEYLKDFPEANIHCFEPHSESFEILNDRFCDLTNLHCNRLALSNEKGSRLLNCNKFSDTNSFLNFSDEANQIWEKEDLFINLSKSEVSCSTIDLYCEDNEIGAIDILKLDCQGYEKQILEGCTRMLSSEKISLIFTEVSFRQVYKNQTQFHEICSLLEQYNFEVFNFYDNVVKSAQLIQADALFINQNFKSRSSTIQYLI